jgi:peptide/nickel transport system substrate-binding protein
MPYDLGDLDPAVNYDNASEAAMTLVYRALTTYKEQLQPGGGVDRVLVGDLAETTGEDVHHDCKVWRDTLKQGIRFEDGSTITSADVAYGISRSFAPDLASGPHYIQQWLADSQGDFNQIYRGPYDGGALLPPGITTPDDRTIQFDFAHPHCEMPYAAALAMTSPVPRAKDTRQAYGSRPFASGPYRIVEASIGPEFTLARNPYWAPTTDAVRTADPDEIRFTLNVNADGLTKRLIADEGADRTAMTWLNVIPPDIALAQSPEVQSRIVSGPTPFLAYLGINTQRVTDINVRRAINIAIDKQAVVQAIGGAPVGIPTGQLLPPSIPGYRAYNAFPGTPVTGDPDKVRQLLRGKTVHLTLAAQGGPGAGYQETAIRDALLKAGFVVTLQPVTNTQAAAAARDNPYDLYLSAWGADWPTGASMLVPLFDGRTILADGNSDVSYLNAGPINTRIAQILNEPVDQAADQWAH